MTNPSKLGRMAASRLKVIHETNRESNQDTLKNLSSSSVAYFDKENEGITQSTYYDSGLNFFSRWSTWFNDFIYKNINIY